MIARTILAAVPRHLVEQVNEGSAEQIGMVVRDAASKKILAHLQETGATQGVVGGLLNHGGGLVSSLSNPAGGLASFATVVQNEQIKRRLDVMQSMLGGMQALQMATLVTAVAGIGVTVASTAILMSRLNEMDRHLSDIGDRIDLAREKGEDWDLNRTMGRMETYFDRLQEADTARNAEPIVRRAEEELHVGFRELSGGVETVLARRSLDAEYLTLLFSMLSVCASAQIRSLMWLDELNAVQSRGRSLVQLLQRLTQAMPQDVLAERLSRPEAVSDLDSLTQQIRLRLASVPGLALALQKNGVGGRDYLEQAAAEEEEPLLVVAPG